MKKRTRIVEEYHFDSPDCKILHNFGDMFSDEAKSEYDIIALNLFRSMNRVFERHQIDCMLSWIERMENGFNDRIKSIKDSFVDGIDLKMSDDSNTLRQHQIDNISVWLREIKDMRIFLTIEDNH